MDSFKTFLTEKYVNLLPTDEDQKREYAPKVWDMLQKSYAPLGGIKGNGFNSQEDMIKKIPFWKVVKKNGKVIAALMYKDKGGRKRVATCSDGSKDAKAALANAFKQEPQRGYFEVSKASWGFIRKLLDQKDLIKFMVTPEQAGKSLKTEITDLKDIPTKELDDSGLNPNDPANKPFKKFIYGRVIGGGVHAKVMIGTLGKIID